MTLAARAHGAVVLAIGGLILIPGVDLARAHCRANESAKVLASDGAAYDQFGSAAGVSGPPLWRAVFGARFDEDNGQGSGAAYVFRFDPGAPGGWVEEAKLLPSDGAAGDFFGHSAAISGDILLIGAPQKDDSGVDSGAAYVFRFDPGPPGQWVQQQKLLPDDGAASDHFGTSVAISGDPPGRAVVGALSDSDSGANSGSAYVFRFDPGPPGTWVQEQKLLASDGANGDQFGVSVALAGDPWWRAVIGAYSDDNENGLDAGAAYVFRFDPGPPGTWVQEQKLLPADGAASDMFGWAVAASGPPLWRAVIGAYGDDDSGNLSGSAYVFRFDPGPPGSWVQEQKLLASDGDTGHIFGKSLAASGNIALIGSHRDDESGVFSGAAYVFRHDPGPPAAWIEQAKLLASDGAEADRFAWSVAVAGEPPGQAAIGAHRNDDSGTDCGSGYVFRGLSDCNSNGSLDLCDIAEGTSQDADGNGVPDECQRVVPAVSQWGSAAMAVLLLAAGAMLIRRRPWNSQLRTTSGESPAANRE